MPRNKPQIRQREPLPEGFNTLEEVWVFWDTHSAADYDDVMEDVDAHVDIHSSKVYCAVAKDVLTQAREQARRQGVSTLLVPEDIFKLLGFQHPLSPTL